MWNPYMYLLTLCVMIIKQYYPIYHLSWYHEPKISGPLPKSLKQIAATLSFPAVGFGRRSGARKSLSSSFLLMFLLLPLLHSTCPSSFICLEPNKKKNASFSFSTVKTEWVLYPFVVALLSPPNKCLPKTIKVNRVLLYFG